MLTDTILCLQGKLALRLQETSAPEFVGLIFETLKFVSGGQTGWQRGQAEDRGAGQQRRGQRLGEPQGRGSCGTCPFTQQAPSIEDATQDKTPNRADRLATVEDARSWR